VLEEVWANQRQKRDVEIKELLEGNYCSSRNRRYVCIELRREDVAAGTVT
jgi:hypothetical protein